MTFATPSNSPHGGARSPRGERRRRSAMSCGDAKDGIVNAHVMSIHRVGEDRELSLYVGGTDTEQRHYEWVVSELALPAFVRVRILGPGEVDAPTRQSDRPPYSDEQIEYLRELIEEDRAKLAALLSRP